MKMSARDREQKEIKRLGMNVLRRVLKRMRWDDQGGYPSYEGEGKWGFVTAGLPQVTPEELNALFAFAGIEPDVIEPLGTCETCIHAKVYDNGKRAERGYEGHCCPCKRPRMSNWEGITDSNLSSVG